MGAAAISRRSVSDFQAAVAAKTNATGTIVYVATLNADGTLKVTRNGVSIYPRVVYNPGPNQANTDAFQGDDVTLLTADGGIGRGDAQAFLNSLT